jgi:hypothetical protein
MGAEDPHSVPMMRIEEPERVFDREKVLGRDAASVFPTTAQENADKVVSATQAVVGSMSFVTESELAEIKAKRGARSGRKTARWSRINPCGRCCRRPRTPRRRRSRRDGRR